MPPLLFKIISKPFVEKRERRGWEREREQMLIHWNHLPNGLLWRCLKTFRQTKDYLKLNALFLPLARHSTITNTRANFELKAFCTNMFASFGIMQWKWAKSRREKNERMTATAEKTTTTTTTKNLSDWTETKYTKINK